MKSAWSLFPYIHFACIQTEKCLLGEVYIHLACIGHECFQMQGLSAVSLSCPELSSSACKGVAADWHDACQLCTAAKEEATVCLC